MPILNKGSTSSVFVLGFDKNILYLSDYLNNKINKHSQSNLCLKENEGKMSSALLLDISLQNDFKKNKHISWL